ncbi:TPA: transposase [Vibrio parahaemolyticus]|nr:transposase [Vibrio parahaemolyticus]
METTYPDTEIQLCVIHQIRNSMKYIASKNQKAFMVDLKAVYKAETQNAKEQALDELEVKYGKQYPLVLKSWHRHWDNLATYFKYPGKPLTVTLKYLQGY